VAVSTGAEAGGGGCGWRWCSLRGSLGFRQCGELLNTRHNCQYGLLVPLCLRNGVRLSGLRESEHQRRHLSF
jgi:hypothetical protein